MSPLGHYILRRTGSALLTVLIVLVLNFFIIHLAPGDPIRILAGIEQPAPEMVKALQQRYGLDKPVWVQLFDYIRNILHGDLGRSIISDQPVARLVLERLSATLLLTLTASLIGFIIGTAMGTWSATRYSSRSDLVWSFIWYVFYSMPTFWLGLMLILLFASTLHVLPTSGMTDLRAGYTGLMHYLDVARHLVLPALSIALVEIPVYYRITRSSVVQVLNDDFVTTFRATGMNRSKIFRKYALKNAILPTLTVFGLQLGYVVTGAALAEIVFSWPGMGRLMLSAVMQRDYPLLMGIYLMMAVSVSAMILLTDVLYAVLDPRIRYR